MWPRPRRSALRGATRPVPLGIARSARHPALSAGLRHPRLCLPRPAADHAAKPHAGAVGHRSASYRWLRLLGFVSVIVGVHVPAVLAVQYVAARTDDLAGSGRSAAAAPSSLPRRCRNSRPSHRTRRRRDGELGHRPMITGTLSRYFGLRFLNSVVGSFFGVVALAAHDRLCRAVAPRRRLAQCHRVALAKFHLFRVPQLTERIMPFTVLVGAMSCYLALSRRLELVVARAAGVSAWQFVAPAMIAALSVRRRRDHDLQSARRGAA